MIKYEFKTVREIAERVHGSRVPIDFTFDTPVDVHTGWEPSGWHGLKWSDEFDPDTGCIILGHYGTGILGAQPSVEEPDDIINFILYMAQSMDDAPSGMDADTSLCVDMDTWDPGPAPEGSVEMKFKGIITETLRREVTVTAEDEFEAYSKVEGMYRNEEIILTAEDFFDSEIKVTEAQDG